MLRKIRSLVSNSNHFGIYDNAFSKKECEILINQFEKSDDVFRGASTSKNNPAGKQCDEMCCDFEKDCIVTNIVRPVLISCLQEYLNTYNALGYSSDWIYHSYFNIQKYDGEKDGYFVWHCEQCAKYPGRILAWMFYLNDAKCGTEFMDHPTINAKRGRCVIWPASWTYLHRGVTPNKGVKYIITGWVGYDFKRLGVYE